MITSWQFSDTEKKKGNKNFRTVFWYLLLRHLLPERERTGELNNEFRRIFKLVS